MAFNGEIYNYRELTRAAAAAPATCFATASDTEVIVHLYEELRRGVRQASCDGMFAFAIWDARRRRLLLARDRLGIKPLLLRRSDGERLVFGSEIKALLRHPDVEAQPRPRGARGIPLAQVRARRRRRCLPGYAALPPGHLLVCDVDGVRVRRYWDLSFTRRRPRIRRGGAHAEQLEALLREAVRSHLVSDVPFGAFLSGGIDSSTVVALMSQILDQPVKTFAVGLRRCRRGSFSELPYARLVAERYATDHHEI